MSIAFDDADHPPAWRVGVFVSSSRRPKHVLMVASGEEITEWPKHKDFVRWIDHPAGLLELLKDVEQDILLQGRKADRMLLTRVRNVRRQLLGAV
jgi:hypothetical protein